MLLRWSSKFWWIILHENWHLILFGGHPSLPNGRSQSVSETSRVKLYPPHFWWSVCRHILKKRFFVFFLQKNNENIEKDNNSNRNNNNSDNDINNQTNNGQQCSGILKDIPSINFSFDNVWRSSGLNWSRLSLRPNQTINQATISTHHHNQRSTMRMDNPKSNSNSNSNAHSNGNSNSNSLSFGSVLIARDASTSPSGKYSTWRDAMWRDGKWNQMKSYNILSFISFQLNSICVSHSP